MEIVTGDVSGELNDINASYRHTEIWEGGKLKETITSLSNMRLFAISQFSPSDLNITEKVAENLDDEKTEFTNADISTCYNDANWDIYRNSFLAGYSSNCMANCTQSDNLDTDKMEFSTLEEAKDYLKCCYDAVFRRTGTSAQVSENVYRKYFSYTLILKLRDIF